MGLVLRFSYISLTSVPGRLLPLSPSNGGNRRNWTEAVKLYLNDLVGVLTHEPDELIEPVHYG